MPAPDTAAVFRTTQWSMIVRARASRDDLDRLLRAYWNPIYAYVRRCGFTRADADDIAQQFIQDVVIDRELVARADPERGRFRAFVRTALRRFIIDQRRQRAPRTAELQPDQPAWPREQCDPAVTAEQEFDAQWATRVLEIAMQRLESDCRQQGMDAQWKVFESRILRPAIDGAEPGKVEDLLARLEIAEPQKLYSMLQTMKRKAETMIRAVIAETVEHDEEIDAEYAALRGVLA